ncbi:hypothetical protein TPHA_0P00600 [Tetrapisispora phaffii CBS 4417]|uniref:Phosphoglycerate mutase n=1 Tax=Tetrapisispora phaffii (strain ATCC 24235 / CBS 4417 / NBRC 1672 / NRRL Y-8282 / UCD 70-5) TaxID=1071381 RepID=G8C240_TETPH|nr:hypothetical protein TPHA_0P00600 [Tetrapisispora phaffii CBS 4417]CCE66218.1 hypothetical protein TPHA_0P00600 [Tetrapisispora phaffii CBS 4417]
MSSSTYKIFILRHGQSELNHENIFCGWIDANLTEKGKDQARNSADLIKKYCEDNKLPLPQIGYTSRLVRTQQTIEEIINQWGLKEETYIVTGEKFEVSDKEVFSEKDTIPVFQSWRLNERHYGSWQGQRKPQVLEEYGETEYMNIRRGYRGRPPVADLKREMIQEFDDQGSKTGYEFKEPNRHLKYNPEELAGEVLPNSESLELVVARLEPLLDDMILKLAKQTHHESCMIVAHGSSVRSLLKLIENIADADIKNIDIPNGIPLVIELDKKHFNLLANVT